MHIVHMCTCNNWSTYESCMWNNSRALEKRPCSAKETCVFKEPTNNSHHVCTIRTWEACSWKTEFNHEISILSHTRMCCVFAGYYGISTRVAVCDAVCCSVCCSVTSTLMVYPHTRTHLHLIFLESWNFWIHSGKSRNLVNFLHVWL